MKRVTEGDKLNIRATDWNAMLDAAQAEIDRKANTGGSPIDSGFGPGIFLGRNNTGAALLPGEAVAVDGFHAAPADLVSYAAVILDIAASEDEDRRAMAIARDACNPGELGRFLVAGPAIVKLARLPDGDELFIGLNSGGELLPGDTGQARVLAASAGNSLILLGSGNQGEPPARGMFQLVNVTTDDGPPTVRVCDGANPDGAIAGVATINNQSYSCQAAEFVLYDSAQYFYFKFTPPQFTTGELTGSVCEIVAFADSEEVVSTDTVLYRLIGHAWTEVVDGRDKVRMAQDHPPGNLVLDWYGPCLGMLEGVVDD